jgi:hypothetical protein
MSHVSAELMSRYAAGPGLGDDVVWAVETHLESCAGCRGLLRAAIGPGTASLLERVRANLDLEVRPAAHRSRLVARWVAPALVLRLGMTLLLVLVAVGLDRIAANGRLPSLVLLVAPVAPLLGVAAAWSRGLDPAYELVVASPRAGLYLVLRRTLAVLVLVLPVLTVAGWLVGTSPARWLLPCLAFTAGALALGELVGLHRAATGLAGMWTLAVIAPSLLTASAPVVLSPAGLPGWLGLTAVITVVLVLRRDAYTGLPSGR